MKSDIPKPPALCTASATFAFAYPIIGALHMNGAVVLGNHFCKTLAAIVLVFKSLRFRLKLGLSKLG